MNDNNITYTNITTNNLKNISIRIPKNKITVLCGVNGSGKTSLAYDTIEKISNYEFSKLLGNGLEDTDFKVQKYTNIIPTVSLKQSNYNNNPKSTIATYSGIDRLFKEMFSIYFNKPFSSFSFNKYTTSCKCCNGLGYELIADKNKIVVYDKSILEQPFKTWNSYVGNYYDSLLKLFASDNNIPINVPLKELSSEHKKLLFYSHNDTKYTIRYKQKKSYKNKTISYIGAIKEIDDLIKSTKPSDNIKAKSYTKQINCRCCLGKRFSEDICDLKINNYSIADLYLQEIKDLDALLKTFIDTKQIKSIVLQILDILQIYTNSNIDYLNLNRSIPSLSGGELQRLRLTTILTSKISNILYILDEPSSSIYYKEWQPLFQQIVQLKNNKNTILLIEHNEEFIEQSDNTIILGPEAGSKGGYIISKEKETIKYIRKKKELNEYKIVLQLQYNNIDIKVLKYPVNALIGISGPSGSGKTSLAKTLSDKIEMCMYITQKPISGNANSIVGTYIDILDNIKNEFVKNCEGINKNDISFSHTNGACSSCDGKGYIYIQIPFGDKIKNICTECNGKRFNQKSLSFKFHDLNIYEILTMPINNLIELNIFKSIKIREKLNFLHEIGLDYINLFQETSTLSGGESQRLKLVKNLNMKRKDFTYIIDEPFCGVDKHNIIKTLILFDKIISTSRNTIIMIEHNLFALSQCDYIINIGPGKGKNGGKIVDMSIPR